MNLKKFNMTLLEILIAIGLTSMLLSTLLWFYRDIVFLGKSMDTATQKLFQMRYVENRLSDVFSNIPFNNTEKDDFAFFTDDKIESKKSLVLTFNNGVSQDEEFSNHILARLYLDEKGRLCLATWPSFQKTSVRDPFKMVREVLVEDVESLRFYFYIPPALDKKVVTNEIKQPGEEETPYPPDSWVPEWKKSYKKLPAMVKIIIKQKDQKEQTYVFPLSDRGQSVIYYTLLTVENTLA